MGKFRGKHLRWFWNSLSNLIRILFVNEAAYFFIRIPVVKRIFEELWSHLFTYKKIDKFQERRFHQNSSKNHKFRWLFFKKFDQNSGWKCICSWLQNSHGTLQEFWLEYWWEEPTPHMILEFFKQFDPNFVWKWSCLFFDQNSSGKKNFWRIMKTFVSPIKN